MENLELLERMMSQASCRVANPRDLAVKQFELELWQCSALQNFLLYTTVIIWVLSFVLRKRWVAVHGCKGQGRQAQTCLRVIWLLCHSCQERRLWSSQHRLREGNIYDFKALTQWFSTFLTP